MKFQILRTVALTLTAALLVLTAAGCQTAHGFGKDVEKAGEKIQDGTR